ncbi:MAG TPA: hypothetical protein VGM70_10680 [Pseudolysinimonas sp.]
MTESSTTVRTIVIGTLAPLVLLLGLSGCAGSTTAAPTTAAASASASSGPCEDVTVIVDFGTLTHAPVKACAAAGTAADVLTAAHIDTAGTADYGDSVICRVDALPSPAAESCAKLPSTAYWAMWIKPSASGTWDYAQEGVQTQQLTAGQFLGLVYTAGTDSTPPQG